jgi:hypothetical protein
MDNEHDFLRRVIDVYNHLLYQDVHDSLLQPDVGRRSIPQCRQIFGEAQQRVTVDGG